MADDAGPRPDPVVTPFTYLHLRTPYGPGGGPGTPADYVAAAAGLPALACTDYGSVAAWPAWERACRGAGCRPIYGLVFDLDLEAEPAAPWPLLALAATAAGLRHLVGIHNHLQRADGHAVLAADALFDRAAGLWLVLLPLGEAGAAPFVAAPRRAALAAVERLLDRLPRPEQVLCGLPPEPTEQDYIAERAAAAGLPLVALPTVRYPRPADAALHHLLHPAPGALAVADLQAGPDPDAAGESLQNPGGTLQNRYVRYPAAWALAGAVAASCCATLAGLALEGAERTPGADAALREVVDEALAAAGRAPDTTLAGELAAVARLRQANDLLAARRVVMAARSMDLLLGAPGGLAGSGRVPALLGLCPPDPFGAPPRWLDAAPPAPAWVPVLTVPAGQRAALIAQLQAPAAVAPGRLPELVPAGGRAPIGPGAALARGAGALQLPAATVAALEQALVAGRPAERPVRWRAASADLAPETAEALFAQVTALESLPGPPLADGEALLVLPPGHPLPLLPGAAGGWVAAWSAADCAALGAGLLLLRGDPALDLLQRAQDLAGGPPPPLAADDLRLVLTAGEIAGLPLPLPAAADGGGLDATPDVLAAFCAALLPDDPAAGPGWAALGALLYGPRGPHPWLRTFLRRRVGAVPVTLHYPALAAVLDSTGGLPLYCEQVAILQLLLAQEGLVPPAESLRMQEWLGQAAEWASDYAAAAAAGARLHLALRLKAAAPAGFLAATLESAVLDGGRGAVGAPLLEARRRGLELRPPDVQASAAGFTLEGDAIRWGLAWTRAVAPAVAGLVAARAHAPEGRFASVAALVTAAVAADLPPAYLAELVRAGACDSLGARPDLLAALPSALLAARQAQPTAPPPGDTQMPLFESPPAAPAGPAADPALLLSAEAGMPADGVGPEGEASASSSDEADPQRTMEGAKSTWRVWEAALAGQAFTWSEAAEPVRRPAGAAPAGGAIARRTLGGVTAALVGQTISVVVVLSELRLVPVPGGGEGAERLAVALVEDGTGALPLVLFPPIYTRFRPLLAADTPAIITARVQLAEAWEGAGAGVVLIGEGVQPYQSRRAETELDLTPRKRREPAPGGGAAAPRKTAADPREYSADGQRYYAAPRAAGAPPTADTRTEPEAPAATAPIPLAGQVVLTLAALADEQADEERMRLLKAILLRHPGPAGVLLYFPDDPLVGGPTYMPIRRTVDPSAAFCADVDALLGPGCYTLRATGG